jgi:hypothetical protein
MLCVHCDVSLKNTSLRKMALFPSLGERLDPLKRANPLQRIRLVLMEPSECFLTFQPEDSKRSISRNIVVLDELHNLEDSKIWINFAFSLPKHANSLN